MADQSDRPLRAAEKRPLRVRLLGGLVVFITTLYCGAKRRTGEGRGSASTGLYPELSVLRFSEGVSPALADRIGRMAALLPSFAVTQKELATEGVDLNVKEVHRIATQLGAEIVTTRRRDLLSYRKGMMTAGLEFQGKRIGVAIDGGRTRIRTLIRRQKGKGKKRRRRKWKLEWREPKVFILFELDDNGRMKANTRPLIEATFQGPNECCELLAMRLHQMGAAQAKEVVFLADGAPWIWERLAWIEQRVGLKSKRVVRVLDFCHAVHHLSLALKGMKLSDSEYQQLYTELRKKLKAGRANDVTAELSMRAEAAGVPSESTVWTDIRYLENHAERGHMKYRELRRRGLPMGSGAIESAIRRVVNLRLKGNGITWYEENAEGMLALRAAVLTGRWSAVLEHVRESMSRDRSLGWEWTSPDLPAELKSGKEIRPPCAKSLAEQGELGQAA